MAVRKLDVSGEATSQQVRSAVEQQLVQLARTRPHGTIHSTGAPSRNVQAGLLQHVSAMGPSAAPRAARQLQRQYGNHYVARLAAQARQPGQLIVHAKLIVTPPGDRYEQEADRAAALAQLTAAQPDSVQRAALSPVGPGVTTEASVPVMAEVEAGIQAARGGGQPLPEAVRGQMEEALGANFGAVVIHDDTCADALNRTLQARAFTTGRDIFFRQGEYQPGSAAGRALLAHELAHVVQQQMYIHTSRGAQHESSESASLLSSVYNSQMSAVPKNIVQRAGVLDSPPKPQANETEQAAKVRRTIAFIGSEYNILRREKHNWQTLMIFLTVKAVELVKELRSEARHFDRYAFALLQSLVIDLDKTIKQVSDYKDLRNRIVNKGGTAENIGQTVDLWKEFGDLVYTEIIRNSVFPWLTASIRQDREALAERIGELSAHNIENADNLENIRKQLLTLTNNMRGRENKRALQRNPRLDAAAQSHAIYLAINRRLGHTGERDTLPADRLRQAGYPYEGERGHENAASVQSSPLAAIKTWMSSPQHRDNILNGGFTLVGFGYASLDPKIPERNYWVQVFA